MGFIERMVQAMAPAATVADQEAAGTEETEKTSADPEKAAVKKSTEEESAADQSVSAGKKTYSEEEMESILAEHKKTWETERMNSLSKDSQIEELKAELLRRDLKEKVVSRLEEAKLPLGVADFVQYTDEAETMEQLERVISTIGQLVQDGVNMRLRGRTPEGLGNVSSGTDAFANAFTNAMKGKTNNR